MTTPNPITGLRPVEPTSPTTVREMRLTPHPQYYFSSGDTVVVVERMRYRVHACLLAPHSEMFSDLITNDVPEAYITLNRTRTAEFEAFLSLVYPAQLGVLPNPDETGWRNILSFASVCGFSQLILTALKGLDAHLAPVEKLLLGDKLSIPELSKKGLREICIRISPPTLEEGDELGIDNIVSISNLREKTQCYQPNKVATLTDDLLQRALAQRRPASAPPTSANATGSADAGARAAETTSSAANGTSGSGGDGDAAGGTAGGTSRNNKRGGQKATNGAGAGTTNGAGRGAGQASS